MSDPRLSNFDERELDLFDAFKAGFEASDEQFNADYLSFPYMAYDKTIRRYDRTEALESRLLDEFKEWRNR